MEQNNEYCSLFFKESGSDKVYKASLEYRSPTQWTVDFQYGRRGSALTMGTKTSSPVSYELAKKEFDKLVKSKKSKGYTEDQSGTSFVGELVDKEDTGFRPMLLDVCPEEDLEKYLTDDNYCLQEKIDGCRLTLLRGETIRGANRKGLTVSLTKEAIVAASILPQGKYDGEIFSDHMVVFDMPNLDGGYKARYHELCLVLGNASDYFHIPPTAFGTKNKRELYDRLVRVKAEGVVFKDLRAGYIPGKGHKVMWKYKFWESATCIVIKQNSQRSVEVAVLDTKEGVPTLVSVGNVTIPANKEVPRTSQFVEIKYLYFYPGGSLFQPQYLSVREDVTLQDCLLSKLKTKREDE